jgi:hypothetical protein
MAMRMAIRAAFAAVGVIYLSVNQVFGQSEIVQTTANEPQAAAHAKREPEAVSIAIISKQGRMISRLVADSKKKKDKPASQGLTYEGDRLVGSIAADDCVADLHIEFSDSSVFDRQNVDLCNVAEIVFE